MKKTLLLTILFSLVVCGSMSAQTKQAAVTENGKEVKRITFDKEKITLVYADGTQEEGIAETTIRRQETTGIQTARQQNATTAVNSWYTMDGRRLQAEPRNKGVYMKKQGNRVRKTVKK